MLFTRDSLIINLGTVYFPKVFFLKNLFYFKLIFIFMFSNHFNFNIISKIIFKNKKKIILLYF